MLNNKRQSGFSLVETMVSMGIFFIIMYGVYVMIVHYGDASRADHARRKMQQESRYMASAFASELREAGCVFTAGSMSNRFKGIYPLNSTYHPDGIIVAAGTVDGFTRLTSDFSAGNGTMQVAHEKFANGDRGIVINDLGYYVFTVEEANGTSLTLRGEPVYYSGLLMSTYYTDPETNKGNTISFASGDSSFVIPLEYFSIYMVKGIYNERLNREERQFIQVIDTRGEADPLLDGSTATTVVISENIWDIQISYLAYTDIKNATPDTPIDTEHYYYAWDGETQSPTSADISNLLEDIMSQNLKEIQVDIVSLSDEMTGRGEDILNHNVPRLGDQAPYTLPDGPYTYKISTLRIKPWNFYVNNKGA